MCNFFRPHFTAIPREDDRIATPLFHTVYLPLSKKKKEKKKRLQFRRAYTLNRPEGLQGKRGM